jgi:hypothetical protein
MEKASILKMEDNLNIFQMEDNLFASSNGRRPFFLLLQMEAEFWYLTGSTQHDGEWKAT